MSYYF